jgi:hypothetical protein
MPKFADIPTFTKSAPYSIDMPWYDIEHWIGQHSDNREDRFMVDLNPDFQRGHVWTTKQQIAYIEYALRGPTSGKDIYWNCSTWGVSLRNATGKIVRPMYSTPLQIVDGLQRLTAVRRFLADEIPAYESRFSQYTDRLRMTQVGFKFHINDLPTRAEVLTWYLEINHTGTPHSTDELRRVRALLRRAKAEGLHA